MYEKEIKELELQIGESHGKYDASDETLRTAIALMRAAEPKDPDAEQEHVRAFVNEAAADGRNSLSLAHVDGLLLRARAAVRAECEQRLRHATDRAERNHDEVQLLRSELATLKAAGAPKDPDEERAECMRLAIDLDDECSDAQLRYLARKIGEIRAAMRAEMQAAVDSAAQTLQKTDARIKALEQELAALKAAGAPKNPDEEREHCAASARSHYRCYESEDNLMARIWRERAAVRAESYIRGREDHANDWRPELERLKEDVESWKRRYDDIHQMMARAQQELAAVRAESADELATAKQMYQNERSLNQRLTRELAALKAEIQDLRDEMRVQSERDSME